MATEEELEKKFNQVFDELLTWRKENWSKEKKETELKKNLESIESWNFIDKHKGVINLVKKEFEKDGEEDKK